MSAASGTGSSSAGGSSYAEYHHHHRLTAGGEAGHHGQYSHHHHHKAQESEESSGGSAGSSDSESTTVGTRMSYNVDASFHRPKCGCESRVHSGALVDWIWHEETPADTVPRLKISYIVPHHNVTGGMKMIMRQIELLHKRGHWVQAVFRGAPGSPVLPSWAPIRVDAERLLKPSQSWVDCFDNSDIIIVGYFTQLLEILSLDKPRGAVVYWEQGHEHLFGDKSAAPDWDRVFHATMHLPIVLLSVSDVVQQVLYSQFGRIAPVIPNGICSEEFHPPTHPHRPGHKVLLVGNPGLPFKNFSAALQTLNIVHQSVPDLQVVWICQVKPSVSGITFPLSVIVNPPQSELPHLYRGGYDVFLFTSLYEAWGMPVLEAMATGLPVVTSQCMGINMFCQSGYNCLIASPSDPSALAASVLKLLQEPTYAAKLGANARTTAMSLTWDAAISTLEAALHRSHHFLTTGALAT